MGAERRFDFDPQSGTPSLGALAGYLRQSCGHVAVDRMLLQRGYRFYPAMSDEVMSFFNKRYTTGVTGLAVTLQGGIDLSGNDPLEECETHAQATEVLERGGADSIWLASLTVGNRMYSVSDLAAPLFIAQHPVEFTMLGEELVALQVMQGASCPVCTAA